MGMIIDQDYNVDKTTMPRGPWHEEPDKVQWIDEGSNLDCLIVRQSSGFLCGYVGVPPGHPHFGVDYSSLWSDYDVHGGLTYSSACHGHVCHTAEDGRPEVWWLGFDCAHAWDMIPASWSPDYSCGTYRDFNTVTQWVTELAQEVAAKAAAS